MDVLKGRLTVLESAVFHKGSVDQFDQINQKILAIENKQAHREKYFEDKFKKQEVEYNELDFYLKTLNKELEGAQSSIILSREHFKKLETSIEERVWHLDQETNVRFFQDIEQFRQLNERQSEYQKELEQFSLKLNSNSHEINKNERMITKLNNGQVDLEQKCHIIKQ